MGKLTGAGLGLRREMLDDVLEAKDLAVDFWEIAPENWLSFGGSYQRKLQTLTRRHTFTTHGLSLSIGSSDPLDVNFVKQVKQFLIEHDIQYYSEHLSYCSNQGHMYDLMPIPFTPSAVDHVVERIQQVQDILGHALILENVSYYAAPGQQMSEIEFTQQILERSGCELLLDVNNVYVNSINHGYSASEFIRAMPTGKIVYGHIAGHYDEADDLKVDTHGSDVKEEVWNLLRLAYQEHGVFPTLLERDFNIPALDVLLNEVDMIKRIQRENEQQIQSTQTA
ncbi:DUF692 domain-containing protein [Alteromonas facilis]|uniref:HvfB family MNIO-type RiPP peptide maturase n=1 Tax=Alteromonas facilis TaxID=2048004 RepID=UPI00196A5772|nr:DUF692 domain-containing protein [Alteromonas facilis]